MKIHSMIATGIADGVSTAGRYQCIEILRIELISTRHAKPLMVCICPGYSTINGLVAQEDNN